jgi:hypothetical protein
MQIAQCSPGGPVRSLPSLAASVLLAATLTGIGRAPAAELQSLVVEQEKFAAFVPTPVPADGYALLVFIPPWENARLPRGWGPVLECNQMIFVSAAHSGNSANIVGRREPLALLAAGTIMARYPVNPAKVYVGGYSGGSRVALRLAVAHPELFRGALLNAGSDPLGEADFPVPAPGIFARVQESSRMVYLTGENDSVNVEKDAQSAASLRRRCVFDTDTQVIPWTGHDVAGPSALGHALASLQKHTPPDPQKLRACRDRQ